MALCWSEAMKTREVRPSDWTSFLDTFSQQHEGWLVTLEDVPSAGGSRVEARELPLQGVFANPFENTISIALGRTPEQHLTHTIDHPARMVVEQSDAGADQGLRIERQGGRATLLMFKAAARPHEVDGIPGARIVNRRRR